MAKENKRNMGGSGVTAGDLFNKLGRDRQDNSADNTAEKKTNLDNIAFDSLDLTQGGEESDSDLDLNALLRKYMPEFNEEESTEPKAQKGGVLSRIKSTAAEEQTVHKNRDEQLMDALDSAFSTPADDLFTEDTLPTEEMLPEDGTISEYDYEAEVGRGELPAEDGVIGVMEQEEHLPIPRIGKHGIVRVIGVTGLYKAVIGDVLFVGCTIRSHVLHLCTPAFTIGRVTHHEVE